MHLSDLRNRRVVVWGTGREGVAAVRAVAPHGPANLTVIDDGPTGPGERWGAELAALAPLVVGPDAFDTLMRADVIIRSPGVPQVHPWVVEARHRGILVTGGTALWMAEHAPTSIGVTGSKGKSTTASLVSHILTGVGQPNVLGGNIGIPVLDLPLADRYVLELSMYQCADLQHSPAVATVTSLYPEHLDWSGGESAYYHDKLNLVAHGPRAVVVNGHDPRLAAELARLGSLPIVPTGTPDSVHVTEAVDDLRSPGGGRWIHLGPEPLFPRRLLTLLGRHNEANLCVALGTVAAAGVDLVAERDRLATAVGSFRPLDFRLTPIEDPSGVTFVDDTLATVPEATVFAIEAYVGRPLTVLVGGHDRGVSYDPLRDYLAERGVVATIIGLPDNGVRILAALEGIPGLTLVPSTDLVDAVRLARQHTPPGGVVLLSPGASSYDHFTNYEHRSKVFRQAIVDTARPVPGTL